MSKFDAFDRATGSDDNDVVRDGPPTCPTSMEILELALEIGTRSHSPVAQHARSCAECQARVAGLRRMLGDVAAFGDEMRPNSDRCFDEAALAELVDGLPPDDQSVRVAHLAICRHCRTELAAFIDLMADESVSAEIRRLETPSIPRGRRKRARLAALGLSTASIARRCSCSRRRFPAAVRRSNIAPRRSPLRMRRRSWLQSATSTRAVCFSGRRYATRLAIG